MNLDHRDKFLVLGPKTKVWLPLFFLCTDYIFWVWVTWAWRWLSNKGAAAVQLICGGFQSHLVDLAPIRVRHCPARQSLLAFPLQASCTFNHTAERFLQGIWSRLGLANEEWQQEVRVIQLQKCCCTKSWLAAGKFLFFVIYHAVFLLCTAAAMSTKEESTTAGKVDFKKLQNGRLVKVPSPDQKILGLGRRALMQEFLCFWH